MDGQLNTPIGDTAPISPATPGAPIAPATPGIPPAPTTPVAPATPPTPPLAQAQKPKSQLPQIAILVSVSLIAAIAIGMLIWVYTLLDESKTNVDGKIEVAKAEALETQRAELEANFAAREKLPSLEFTGPDDYGRLSFMYPRTWSVYVDEDASKGGDFMAYLNPRIVGPVADNNRFALRVTIYDRPYDTVLKTFDSLVNSNPPKLTSSVFQVGENTGTRLEGEFSKDITGIAVLLKINDKTVYIRTDTPEVTRADFETLIQTIRFN